MDRSTEILSDRLGEYIMILINSVYRSHVSDRNARGINRSLGDFFCLVQPDDEVEHFELITSPVSGAFADRQLNAHLNVLASLDFETISMYSLLLRVVVS